MPETPRQAEVDSLMGEASERLEAKDARGAVSLFEEVVRIDPNQAPAHRMLGAIWVAVHRLDEAEQAYERARKIDDSADSWFGLGMVAAASGGRSGKRKAVDRFREAIRRDWHQVEARYQLALVLYDLGEPGAEFELEQLVRINKTYTAAYLTLFQWEEHKPGGLKEAVKWCDRGLMGNPEDPDLLIRRAELRAAAGDLDKAIEELAGLLRGRPDKFRSLPLLAQAHLSRGRLGAAEEAFRVYLDRLDPQERSLYEDISMVWVPEEAKGVQALPKAGVPDFLRQFWARRDVDLVEGVNRRRLEHSQRVWVARTQFSRGRLPWNRRGEIYIRYGEPDLRQRSEASAFKEAMHPKVRAVRDKMAAFFYGAAMVSATTVR